MSILKHLQERVNEGADSVSKSSTRSVRGFPEATATEIVELGNGDSFTLHAGAVCKHIGDAMVKMLAYNGSIPGPTLKVVQGSTVIIRFTNDTEQETIVNWHGLRFDNSYDGVREGRHPGMWPLIPAGGSFSYQLRFSDSGVYWYHSHICEDDNQGCGLYGSIIVVPSNPDYWAPVNREYSLCLDDIPVRRGLVATFSKAALNRKVAPRPSNTMLVNGETNGTLRAKRGEVIRLYLTNVAGARAFNVRIPGARMKLVGSDNGRVEREMFVEEVLVAPSERTVLDVHFDRSGRFHLEHRIPGKSYQLGAVEVVDEEVDASYKTTFETLRYNADFEAQRERLGTELERIPDKTITFIDESSDTKHHGVHHLTHTECEDSLEPDRPLPTFRGMCRKIFTVDPSVNPHRVFRAGDRIKVRIINKAHSDYPMPQSVQFYGQHFLVLSRDGVPNDNLAWKDTVVLRIGEVVDILVETLSPGAFIVHGHITEQSESGLMFTYGVRYKHQLR